MSSIASVGNEVLRREPVDERDGLGAVMALTGRESQAQRITQHIYAGMDFAGEPASVASE